jgi:hypothetical protein
MTRELSRAATLVSMGRKWPQSMQREPSSRHSSGGRSQTCPRTASWRAVVWWAGHWSWKVERRVANEVEDAGWIMVLVLIDMFFYFACERLSSVSEKASSCSSAPAIQRPSSRSWVLVSSDDGRVQIYSKLCVEDIAAVCCILHFLSYPSRDELLVSVRILIATGSNVK